MRQSNLGTLEVSRIGLGTMGMSTAYTGAGTDDAGSVRTIHRALELGVTLIDTAEVYGPYTNEELVGRAISGRRDAGRAGHQVRHDLARWGRSGPPRQYAGQHPYRTRGFPPAARY